MFLSELSGLSWGQYGHHLEHHLNTRVTSKMRCRLGVMHGAAVIDHYYVFCHNVSHYTNTEDHGMAPADRGRGLNINH